MRKLNANPTQCSESQRQSDVATAFDELEASMGMLTSYIGDLINKLTFITREVPGESSKCLADVTPCTPCKPSLCGLSSKIRLLTEQVDKQSALLNNQVSLLEI